MSLDVRLKHSFGAFTLDCDFTIDRNGITALFGPSGAGKTSVVRAIAGLVRPDSGRVVIAGRVVLDTEQHVSFPPNMRRAGYVFQDARLFPHMNVGDNLLFGWRRADEKASDEEVARIVDMLGLRPFLERKPANLSGGEKSRVALGRALLSAPQILLLDEPLAALDEARKQEILPYLERLRDDAALPIIHVSHSVDEVTRLADEVIVLERGRIVARGSVFDIASRLDPLSGVGGYCAVLEAAVSEADRDGVSVLRFSGGEIVVSALGRPEGARVRVRIRADDVMIAREKPVAISANNILAARITAMREDGTHADVQMSCGEALVVARITRASMHRLELREGLDVFAVVKSMMVDSGGARRIA